MDLLVLVAVLPAARTDGQRLPGLGESSCSSRLWPCVGARAAHCPADDRGESATSPSLRWVLCRRLLRLLRLRHSPRSVRPWPCVGARARSRPRRTNAIRRTGGLRLRRESPLLGQCTLANHRLKMDAAIAEREPAPGTGGVGSLRMTAPGWALEELGPKLSGCAWRVGNGKNIGQRPGAKPITSTSMANKAVAATWRRRRHDIGQDVANDTDRCGLSRTWGERFRDASRVGSATWAAKGPCAVGPAVQSSPPPNP